MRHDSNNRVSGILGAIQKAYDVMSDFIKQGEWGPGFNAQNQMLDEYSKKFKLEDQDWRPQKPWYKPAE